jgi:GT2 family glycosyltransferase
VSPENFADPDNLPDLDSLLAPDNRVAEAASAELRDILAEEHRPICILGHNLGGGAEDYADRRCEKLLDLGRAVLQVKFYPSRNLLMAAARRGGACLAFTCRNLEQLAASGFPRLDRFIVNTFCFWRVEEGGEWLEPRASLPALLGQFLRLAERHRAGFEMAYHEHYPVCPNYVLLNTEARFCGVPASPDDCAACLAGQFPERETPFDLSAWRKAWAEFISRADRIVFFSRSSREILGRTFQLAPGQAMLLPHDPLVSWPIRYSPPAEAPLIIGAIGALGLQKGSRIVLELAEILSPGEKLVVIGSIDHRGELPPGLIVTGPYRREDLPQLLSRHGVTVGFIPSVYPETFHYVTQECMALGLPLVCFPVGAHAERIALWEHGLVTRKISVVAALAALRELDARRLAPPSKPAESEIDASLEAALPKFLSPGEKPVFAEAAGKTADLLLTVYNGYDFLEPCLESALANVDVPFRLFLNDDASDDPRVGTYLEEIRRRHPERTRLYRNRERRGFPESVDRMLRDSANDVVLINSDTAFPKNWASRLLWPLWHSGAKVASATPLSNSGTSCAFPVLNRDSELFAGLELDDIDSVCQRARPEGWQEMPTGVGFCLALARRALDEAGTFDVETFSPGYGEEVDWCRRTASLGYRHVLLPNLFVYHKHGGIYRRLLSEERRRLLDSHNRIIEARYPDYLAAIHAFFRHPPYLAQRDLLLLLASARAAGGLKAVFAGPKGGKGDAELSPEGDAALAIVRPVPEGGFSLAFRFREYGGCLRARSLAAIGKALALIPGTELELTPSARENYPAFDYARLERARAAGNPAILFEEGGP